jgi:hypothetical protein
MWKPLELISIHMLSFRVLWRFVFVQLDGIIKPFDVYSKAEAKIMFYLLAV